MVNRRWVLYSRYKLLSVFIFVLWNSCYIRRKSLRSLKVHDIFSKEQIWYLGFKYDLTQQCMKHWLGRQRGEGSSLKQYFVVNKSIMRNTYFVLMFLFDIARIFLNNIIAKSHSRLRDFDSILLRNTNISVPFLFNSSTKAMNGTFSLSYWSYCANSHSICQYPSLLVA